MDNFPIAARNNVKVYKEHMALVVSPGPKRHIAWFGSGAVFLGVVAVEIKDIYRSLINSDTVINLWEHFFWGGIALFTGYLTFIRTKNIVMVSEVLLVPEERKIIIRRERSKKVVSEHSVDDIQLQHERVSQEDPSTPGMYWFTIYDTRLKKQIFAIRPGESQSDDAMAVGELEDFFNEVMYPEEYAKKRHQEQKEIEERNRALREQSRNTSNDESKWDSLT